MVVSCCVIDCTNRYSKDNPQSFYRIPKNPQRRNQWVAAIRRVKLSNGAPWNPTEHDRVCCLHFVSGKKSDKKDDIDYVPSVNLGYSSSKADDSGQQSARQERILQRGQRKDELETARLLVDLHAVVPDVPNQETHVTEQSPPPIHDNCIQAIRNLQEENSKLHRELLRLQDENSALKKEISDAKLSENFIATDQKTAFYTGVPSYALFLWMVTFCSSILPSSKALKPPSVLLCILMKLRLNLQHQDLAYRFNISVGHVSEIINQGLPKVASQLSFLIQWPSRENLVHHMPPIFKQLYPKCVSIIDCFEVFIQRPGHLTTRAQTWSNYKHHNTIKFLVSITPTGAISFLSRAFGGRVSDKVITQRSGYLDNLQYGDTVLADRGFLIAEDVAAHHASLVIPAFTKGKSQLSARDVEQTRKIARVRIHVERAIERMKNFRVLSSTMSMYMVPHADSVVTICSAICNLQPKLVS